MFGKRIIKGVQTKWGTCPMCKKKHSLIYGFYFGKKRWVCVFCAACLKQY